MTDKDRRRAAAVGYLSAKTNAIHGNPAAGVPAGDSFEAQVQIDADLARSNRQGVPSDTPWFAAIMRLFRF